MSVDVLTILTATSSISGILAIIIVFWDRIKNHRKKAKRVQKFYSDIETYIFLSYKLQKLRFTIISISKQDIEKLTQIYTTDFRRFQTAYGHIQQNFNDYAKYLGIARIKRGAIVNSTQIQIYINPEPSVNIMTIEDKENTDIKKSLVPQRKNITGDPRNITEPMIQDMMDYCKSLRMYWNEHYARFIVKPKLKPNHNLDFRILLEGTDQLYRK